MLFTDMDLRNLENRFVALMALLVSKGVLTLEEFQETVASVEEQVKEQTKETLKKRRANDG